MKLSACILLATMLVGVASNADLIGHWKLDEGSGASSLSDASGNGHTANSAGGGAGVTLGGAGLDGPSGSFNGNGFFTPANNPDLAPRSFTMSFWMKADPVRAFWRTAVSNRAGEDGFIFYRQDNTDFMTFWAKGPGGGGNWNAQNAPAITDFSQWYHVVGSYDDATQEKKLYFHGENDAWGTSILSMTATGAYVVNSQTIGIGARGASGELPWGGGTNEQLLDDIQYYDVALGEGQVEFLFNNPGTVIPEPSSLGLLGMGLVLIGAFRARKLR